MLIKCSTIIAMGFIHDGNVVYESHPHGFAMAESDAYALRLQVVCTSI